MRALLSVANREGIAALARDLRDLDVEIFATDGTREFLASEGIDVASVNELTDSQPTIGGQVKTFHHAVYAGILARRDVAAQMDELKQQKIAPIDLVVVNVKPFAPAVGVKLVGLDEAIEMIDVGGAALLGAAARNAAGVAAASDPAHYEPIVNELREHGQVTAETRARLAAEAFSTVAAYHAEIAAYLNQIAGNTFPSRLALVLEKVDDLRYGENPHQRAAFYRETTHRSATLADATQVQGGSPSFNNLLDLDAAWHIASDFKTPTVCIVKHGNPCGLASVVDLAEAFRGALEGDSVSAYGGIIGVNRVVDEATARAIRPGFFEAIVAPGYTPEALEMLRTKKGFEIVEVTPNDVDGPEMGIGNFDFKRIGGGLLVQTFDSLEDDRNKLQVVTQRRPTLEELTDLLFAWRAVRHVRSNAIVLAKKHAMIGMGAGQPSRVVSVEVALRKAGERAPLSVMASDAYFPFPDGIQIAAQAGVTAIIQPGGSIRDEMAIEVADRHHMAMVFTGRRHFRH